VNEQGLGALVPCRTGTGKTGGQEIDDCIAAGETVHWRPSSSNRGCGSDSGKVGVPFCEEKYEIGLGGEVRYGLLVGAHDAQG
jgi:hypothetical protein